jgi:sulfur-carrier protein
VRIEVRLFGALAERAGTARVTVEVAEGETAGDVVAAVGERHPEIAGYVARVSVAVDHEVVSSDRPVP